MKGAEVFDENSDHDPPHTYMVVAGHGFLIDLSRVSGELWNQNNVASCA
jgi:hypothetical protein